MIDENKIYLSISEGRFHQIKKMFESIGNKVIELKRVSI
jgi:16S rRNA pseudouridine516 synthase